LNIGLITLSRQGAYVHQTLADLFEATDGAVTVDLFPGNLDTAYLDRYRSDPRITIRPMSSDDWALIEPWSPVRRCSFNFWRAFNHYLKRSAPVCLCRRRCFAAIFIRGWPKPSRNSKYRALCARAFYDARSEGDRPSTEPLFLRVSGAVLFGRAVYYRRNCGN
jgi:hypothetical protein